MNRAIVAAALILAGGFVWGSAIGKWAPPPPAPPPISTPAPACVPTMTTTPGGSTYGC